MKELWGGEDLTEDEPWNSQAFRNMSRRQQNLEIYKVIVVLHINNLLSVIYKVIFTINITDLFHQLL